jgi:hypothetical protein
MISSNVVILTREEFERAKTASFHRGVERGRFEEGCDRSKVAEQTTTTSSVLNAAVCLRAALREMVTTFEQPRFDGVYPECLERSREALALGDEVLSAKKNEPAPTYKAFVENEDVKMEIPF